MKNADIQHHKLDPDTEETEMATSIADRHPKPLDEPEKPPSGIGDLSYRRDFKEKQEDQTRDEKMT